MVGRKMNKGSSCKEYNAIDIMKLVLAVLVMVIHSGADKTIISPVLRTAVPLFFVISSYFFFSKNQRLLSKKERNAALGKLVKRNLFLYLFWATVQLPLMIFMRGYHHSGMLSGVWYAFRDVLLGGGFTGAWFIVALVVGIVIVYWLSKKISSGWMVLLTLPVYILCCLLTNYHNLLDAHSIVLGISNGYHAITGSYFYTSFPVALFWVALGRALAEKKLTIKTSILLVFGVLFAVLIGLERYWIVNANLGITDDCYFMLILVCPVIFLLVGKSKLTFTTGLRIREISTILYVTHGTSGRLLGYMLKVLPFHPGVQIAIKMVLSLFAAFVICQLLVYLREKKNMKIFKYSY